MFHKNTPTYNIQESRLICGSLQSENMKFRTKVSENLKDHEGVSVEN